MTANRPSDHDVEVFLRSLPKVAFVTLVAEARRARKVHIYAALVAWPIGLSLVGALLGANFGAYAAFTIAGSVAGSVAGVIVAFIRTSDAEKRALRSYLRESAVTRLATCPNCDFDVSHGRWSRCPECGCPVEICPRA